MTLAPVEQPDWHPRFAGVAGDWHGNTRWALSQIKIMSTRLRDEAGEEFPVILHAGDFGIWPGRTGQEYLAQVTLSLTLNNATLWFAEGNHEDYGQLLEWSDGDLACGKRIPVTQRISWLTRGHRWAWHGHSWLALGGAASIDRAARTPGKDWWQEERITAEQASRVVHDGHADVMLTHDAPAGVPLRYPQMPPAFDGDHAICTAHRETLRGIVNKVEPSYLIHGHHHQGRPGWDALRLPLDMPGAADAGPIRVCSLDMDGTQGNWGILDTRDMRWM
jgi:hypothetical protein